MLRAFTTIALIGVAASVLPAQERPTYPDEAVQRMRHLEGAWRMESDVVDAQGNITSTAIIHDTLVWVIPDRVLGFVSRGPGPGDVGTGLWFYDTSAERFYLISVNGQTGDLWTLSGTLDEWTITSEPRRRADGSEVILRFHHHDIEEDSFRATMEYSLDDGATWTVGYRQRLTRLE